MTPRANVTGFDAQELFALAKLDLSKGLFADALEKLKTATADANPPAGAYSVCGQVYLQLELLERAQGMFTKHLERHPGTPDEMFFLGSVHFQAGRADEALKLWDAVLQKYPAYAAALLYRAILRAQRGQLEPAKQDLETLMKVTPVDNPYFKPAKDLIQQIEARAPRPASPAPAAAPAATPAVPPILPGNAYKS